MSKTRLLCVVLWMFCSQVLAGANEEKNDRSSFLAENDAAKHQQHRRRLESLSYRDLFQPHTWQLRQDILTATNRGSGTKLQGILDKTQNTLVSQYTSGADSIRNEPTTTTTTTLDDSSSRHLGEVPNDTTIPAWRQRALEAQEKLQQQQRERLKQGQ